MTCSIIARDPSTGELGGGVFTHWFGCSNVLTGKAGIGIVATQALTNSSYGPNGIKFLEAEMPVEEVVKKLTLADELREMRQLGVLDNSGNYFQYSGSGCVSNVCVYQGDDFCVQASMMSVSTIAEVVGKAFEKQKDLPLAERILCSLKAGQEEGGDLRGRQGCALVTLSGSKKEAWKNYNIQLKVDDHTDPLGELERLLKINRGYEKLDKAEGLFAEGKQKKAIMYFEEAEEYLGKDHTELQFWKTDALMKMGIISEKEGIFLIQKLGKNWEELYRRLL